MMSRQLALLVCALFLSVGCSRADVALTSSRF